METPPSEVPSHLYDSQRLEVLQSTQLLDSGPEEEFDRLTRLAAQLLRTPAAQINLLDTRRQFFKSDYQRNGPSSGGGEVPLEHSFCQYVVAEQKALAVEDARAHPVLCSNMYVLAGEVVSYLGVPLTTGDGFTLGSLCAFDTVPRTWPAEHISLLKELAALTVTEIELRRTVKQLEANYEALQKLELQRVELVNMLVHDLRNPLASIVGGLELIDSADELTQQTRGDVNIARVGAQVLTQMVTEILEVAKAEAEHMGLSLTATTPGAIVDSAARRLQQLATTQGVTLRKASNTGAVALQADERKLCRVLINLIANAIQHSPSGSTIVIETMLEPHQEQVTFSVQDKGTGIPSDVLPRLFEKFQTGHGKLNKGAASTGLGLSFCKMVVEAHGGTIRAETMESGGALFSVTLPLAQRA